MKPFIRLCIVVCAIFISQITFAQSVPSYRFQWSKDGLRFVVTEVGVANTYLRRARIPGLGE